MTESSVLDTLAKETRACYSQFTTGIMHLEHLEVKLEILTLTGTQHNNNFADNLQSFAFY